MEQEEGDFVHSRILLAGKNGEKNLPWANTAFTARRSHNKL
jgi:hypothetical protein